jgi:hypothetical protein
MEFATPNHRPSFTGWDNTPDASVTHGGVPSGKLCWVVIKCVAWPILVILSFLFFDCCDICSFEETSYYLLLLDNRRRI